MSETKNKASYILGINGGVRPGYQDISAVLMRDGKVIAAIEEERITRVKHLAGQLPILSVKEVLKIANITINDVSVVAFHGSTWQPAIDKTLQQHFNNYFGYCPPVKRYHHHLCHAASAFFASGFDEALIITADGSGDGISTQVAIGKKSEISVVESYSRPQSLGMFYSMITQVCGFTRDADEYKLMGLAAYGNKHAYDLDNILKITPTGYSFDADYMVDIPVGQPSPSRHEMLFSNKLLDELKIVRRNKNQIEEAYKNLAASAQFQLEKALIGIVKKHAAESGIKNICMAGGVALNCLANQKIEMLDGVGNLFIQPASNDAGISLGAAYLASIEAGNKNFEKQTHTFLGNEHLNEEIQDTLKKCNLNFVETDTPSIDAAKDLIDNKVIGWFQGRMEFGPRALGNRSILANPTTPDIKATVNQKIKFREGFRPFGASVLEEDFKNYFQSKSSDAPFMTKVFDVKPEYIKILEGVTHADGTCRIQTVNQNQNMLFYELLTNFKKLSGHGVLLNTSFNLSHEPIVNSPRDAVASFFASGLDKLYIGNWIVLK